MSQPNPSFVLVQVEGARDALRNVLGRHLVNEPADTDWVAPIVEEVLSALGLDRPGVKEQDFRNTVRAASFAYLSEDLESTKKVHSELLAALAAAKEVGQ